MTGRRGNAVLVVVLILVGAAAAFLLLRGGPSAVTAPLPPASSPPPSVRAESPAPPPAQGASVLKGRVVYRGAVPERKRLPVNKDPEVCRCGQDYKLDESLVVDPETRGVAHAVVWVGNAGPGPSIGPATVDQKGCVFAPHVALITRGQKVNVLNPDRIVHNYHWLSTSNPGGNLSMPKFKASQETPAFGKPELVPVSCDIHDWMHGWVAVMDTGYAAVTDAKGEFSIAGLPPGPWEVRVWHETLAASPKEVRAEAGAPLEIALAP